MSIIRAYLNTNLVTRLIAGFILGSLIGGFLWYLSISSVSKETIDEAMRYCSPFGSVFINMLKMIVVPVIFFSLVTGAASLSIEKLSKAGLKIILWYLSTMLVASSTGVAIAKLVNPASDGTLSKWQDLAGKFTAQSADIISTTRPSGMAGIFEKLLLDFFQNPFNALANANFLAIIVFSIIFGISIRTIIDKEKDSIIRSQMETLVSVLEASNRAISKIVDVVLEYAPVGVFFLAMVIFSVYGPLVIGPYLSILGGVVAGIIGLIFIVYPILIYIFIRENPFVIIKKIREAMIMAFVTRSSAATLPVTLKVAEEELKINPELASFSLPLGATVNMDGTCIHLPIFAVLAANMFGIDLSFGDMIVMVITTVIAAIGTGGVPGGSLMLLFIVLGTIGCTPSQTAVIIALAMGINPIVDMFETMSNVTGDLLCTYVVAKREGLIEK